MKSILILFLLLGFFNTSFSQTQTLKKKSTVNIKSTVQTKGNHRSDNSAIYICFGPKAYAYHRNINCRGLKKCSVSIESINEQDAINRYHRSQCKICY